MKKLSIFLAISLFAMDINPYFFSVKENYKEYINGINIDKDSNSLFDINGVGIKFKESIFKGKIEYAYGEATYNGATQSGNKVKVKETEVYLINALFSVGYPLSFDLGYRFWDRGKSDYQGDYEEKYYWPYIGISLNYDFNLYNFSFKPLLSYQRAFNPKLKILIGNNPTLDLGTTKGYKIELPIYYRVNNLSFFAFYRFQYWHVDASNIYILKLNNQNYPIFEPESETRNQYVGVGLNFSF